MNTMEPSVWGSHLNKETVNPKNDRCEILPWWKTTKVMGVFFFFSKRAFSCFPRHKGDNKEKGMAVTKSLSFNMADMQYSSFSGVRTNLKKSKKKKSSSQQSSFFQVGCWISILLQVNAWFYSVWRFHQLERKNQTILILNLLHMYVHFVLQSWYDPGNDSSMGGGGGDTLAPCVQKTKSDPLARFDPEISMDSSTLPPEEAPPKSTASTAAKPPSKPASKAISFLGALSR